MTHDEMIEVIQAHKEGETIQFRETKYGDDCHWNLCVTACFNFATCDYRIKPEPRSLWVVRMKDGSLYDTVESKDHADRYLENNEGWTYTEYKELLP